MPKPSSSRGSGRKKWGRGPHSSRDGRQNRRQEGLIDERRPDSAVDILEEDGEIGEEEGVQGASCRARFYFKNYIFRQERACG